MDNQGQGNQGSGPVDPNAVPGAPVGGGTPPAGNTGQTWTPTPADQGQAPLTPPPTPTGAPEQPVVTPEPQAPEEAPAAETPAENPAGGTGMGGDQGTGGAGTPPAA